MNADAERAVIALRVLVGAAPEPLPGTAFELALNQARGVLRKVDAGDAQRKAASGYHPCGVCDIHNDVCTFCAQPEPRPWPTG